MKMTAIIRRHFCIGVIAFVGLIVRLPFAAADPLPMPKERPILAISGTIERTNSGSEALFDRPMLEALGMVALETTTPWNKTSVKFEGVLIHRLMEYVGARGTSVIALALNDYLAEIPISDFERFGTMIALKVDGTYLTVKDKGPLFIVYPYDSNSLLKSQIYYGRSVWQLARLVVK